MKTSTWIAIGLFVAVAAWLASGLVIDGGEGEEVAPARPPQPTLVQVRPSVAEEVPRYIYAQGVAQPYRTTDVLTSTGGTLDEVSVKQGDEIEAGTVLAHVRLEARESELRSAQTQVESLEADLQGVQELEAQGFATESRVRELQSQLEEARAALESIRADIRDATVEAPIPGIVSDVFVNEGQTAPTGTTIARIVDNAPLRVTLAISQRDIGSVDVGREAVVSFATGELTRGRVCFVAPAAEPETRTFRVEIRVPNEERKIPSVVSAEVRFQTGEAQAHFVSPAIFALSEAGALGVKSVDDDNTVRFHPVELVQTGVEGVWVGGLPEELQIITTGQGFVREGERVRAEVEEDEGGEEAGAPGAVGSARLPTATVEDREFEGADELPEPPPAEEICRGAAANVVTTSSVPSMPSASTSPDAATGTVSQPGGGAAGQGVTGTEPAGGPPEAGGAAAQPAPGAPSIGPISPSIPSPPTAQPLPQTPGGSTQQGQGGASISPPAGPDAGAAGSAGPSAGGTQGGGQ